MTQNYAAMIDHTLLKAETTKDQIEKICQEALKYEFASVCVNPTWVKKSSELLAGSNVKVCTVIGFPLGATTPQVKAFETTNAIENGAGEIDMVINIGALKDGDYDLVLEDIKAVVTAANGTLVKVIIETSLLTDEEKVKACELYVEAGADLVKTSGGIRSLEDMQKMVEAGATRIGASSGVAIMNGLISDSNY